MGHSVTPLHQLVELCRPRDGCCFRATLTSIKPCPAETTFGHIGGFMKRLETFLRAGVAFAALASGSAVAEAQSTQPPPDVQNAQASPTNQQSNQGEIVITGSRIRRNPLDLDAPRVFIDQQDIQKTGLNSINEVLQRLPSSGGGINNHNNTS